MNKTKLLISWLVFSLMTVNISPVFAVDTSSVPECQFSGPPTAEQMAACQAAAAAAQGGSGQSGSSGAPTDIPANIPANIPTGAGDLSAFTGNLPAAPGFDGNGAPPSFMGKELAGGGMEQAAAQIGNALAMVRDGLLQAEEGIKELKDGKIDVSGVEPTVKEARGYYDQAQAAFESGDYMKAGQYLQKIQGLDLQGKFAALEAKAISSDLISDIRKEMKSALDQLNKLKIDDSDTDEIKAMLIASLDKLDQADAALKKKDAKGAAKIMKELRDSAPQDQAQGEAGKFKGMSQKMMGKILKTIAAGLARGEKGMNNAKAHGVEVPADAIALMEKAKSIYQSAQELYDKEDYNGAAAKLAELQGLNLEEKFAAFKKDMLPPERMKSLTQMIADGIKALELTIQHTKEAGYDTAELEALLIKVKTVYAGAQEASAGKDIETFLTYMDQMDDLDIAGQVDDIIRKLANAEIKDMVAAGIEKINNVAAALEEAIAKLAAKKIDTSNAKNVLAAMKSDVSKAQAKYDAGDYMSAGKFLDSAVDSMISLVNIARDSGVALAGERMKQIDEIINLGAKGDAGQIVISPDKVGQLDQIFSTVGNDEAMDMKQAFMQFDPELMDQVIDVRQKNKKYMDAILRDVMPLIPPADRERMLEGKTGLLEEMAAADKTIANMKRIKGVAADTIKALDKIKEQIKAYNFDPAIAEKLEARMADFNDKIQSGELKDPKVIASYIKVLQEEVAQAIKESITAKMKQGILPAKNIDDSSPYFNAIKKLKDDGAIKPDGKGNIDLSKQLTGKQVADMINKTIDENAVKNAPGSVMTISDAGNMVFNAYDVKPNIDLKNPGQMAKFLRDMGVDVQASDMKDKITLGEAADLISAANDRWGRN